MGMCHVTFHLPSPYGCPPKEPIYCGNQTLPTPLPLHFMKNYAAVEIASGNLKWTMMLVTEVRRLRLAEAEAGRP